MRQDSIHTFLIRAQTHQYGKFSDGIARIGTINIGHQYRPIAQWNGDVFFEDNTMGPGVAVPRLLRRTGLTLSDLDLIEMHEAFGGQVACNLRAWEQGWKEPAIGAVDRNKLNQLGSSIAVGHPFAATGARIVTTLANEMKRRNVRYGLVSICAAGAQASAMILERDV